MSSFSRFQLLVRSAIDALVAVWHRLRRSPAVVPVRSRTFRTICVPVLIMFVTVCTASAQSFGLRGGVEQTQLVNDVESNSIGTETGYVLGAFINIGLPANFGLSVEGLYSQKIVTQQNLELAEAGVLNPEASLELGYVQMPVTLSYSVPLRGPLTPRFYGGPVVGVVVNESINLMGKQAGDIANEAAVLTRNAFADREIGWTAGAGATLGFKGFPVFLIFDMRYIGGVATISDDFEGNPLSRNLKMGAISGMVGIAF
ncbi:MAG: outer membrane beta-barrel protein [Rhodothermales bacterium]|nr:outer membrane beta-barrel protein [Rhodothermales bacterium]